jgi:hypothetical protein
LPTIKSGWITPEFTWNDCGQDEPVARLSHQTDAVVRLEKHPHANEKEWSREDPTFSARLLAAAVADTQAAPLDYGSRCLLTTVVSKLFFSARLSAVARAGIQEEQLP